MRDAVVFYRHTHTHFFRTALKRYTAGAPSSAGATFRLEPLPMSARCVASSCDTVCSLASRPWRCSNSLCALRQRGAYTRVSPHARHAASQVHCAGILPACRAGFADRRFRLRRVCHGAALPRTLHRLVSGGSSEGRNRISERGVRCAMAHNQLPTCQL